MPSYEEEVSRETVCAKLQDIVFDETAKMEFINVHTSSADHSGERLEKSVVFGWKNSFIVYIH